MNNPSITRILEDCDEELKEISDILSEPKIKFDKITKYLTNYAVIRACSALEFAYKNLIADFFEKGQSTYVKNYLSKNLRKNSSNPSLDAINSSLSAFSSIHNGNFNKLIKSRRKEYELSLIILKDARNAIAHGDSSSITISDLIKNYQCSKEVINYLDCVLIEKNKHDGIIFNVDESFNFIFSS